MTFESTFFRSPTPAASVCISPRPLYTCSSRSLTILNDCPRRVSSVFSRRSSTVLRICSSFAALSSCIADSLFSTVERMPESCCSFCAMNWANRPSIPRVSSATVFCRLSCRIESSRDCCC